jgi:hypothetical protein
VLSGCAASGPDQWRPYHPALPPILAIVRDAGPDWSAHADALEGLYAKGRLFVVFSIEGDPEPDAKATWGPYKMIRVREGFLLSDGLRAEDKAALLVVEVCHIVTRRGDSCHTAEQDFLAALREAQD